MATKKPSKNIDHEFFKSIFREKNPSDCWKRVNESFFKKSLNFRNSEKKKALQLLEFRTTYDWHFLDKNKLNFRKTESMKKLFTRWQIN